MLICHLTRRDNRNMAASYQRKKIIDCLDWDIFPLVLDVNKAIFRGSINELVGDFRLRKAAGDVDDG